MARKSQPLGSTFAMLAATLVLPPVAGHAAALAAVVHKVGAVTRHASKFIDRDVLLVGYVLARRPGYILFSDEPTGKISRYDLPVTGAALDRMLSLKKYTIEGTLLDHGLDASNGSRYHLELISPPREVQP